MLMAQAEYRLFPKKSNLKFYNLINEFYKLSNIPVLINTSFNLNNEPIVMTPEDAIRTFFSSGLDFLIIGNFLVRKMICIIPARKNSKELKNKNILKN